MWGRIGGAVRALLIAALGGFVALYLVGDFLYAVELMAAPLDADRETGAMEAIAVVQDDLAAILIFATPAALLCLWAAWDRIRSAAKAPFAWTMVTLVVVSALLVTSALTLSPGGPNALLARLSVAGIAYTCTIAIGLTVVSCLVALIWAPTNAVLRFREPPVKRVTHKQHGWRDDDGQPPAKPPRANGFLFWGAMSCAMLYLIAFFSRDDFAGSADEIEMAQFAASISALLFTAFHLTAAVCFLRRMLRAKRFLAIEGRVEEMHDFAKTIGWIFVPIFGLFRPWGRLGKINNTLSHYDKTGAFEFTDNGRGVFTALVIVFFIAQLFLNAVDVGDEASRFASDMAAWQINAIAAAAWTVSYVFTAIWFTGFCNTLARAEAKFLSAAPGP